MKQQFHLGMVAYYEEVARCLLPICDHIWENQLVSEKNKILFYGVKMLSSKFEANLTLHLRVRRASFSLFPLASSCSNDYFHMYAIINTVTYVMGSAKGGQTSKFNFLSK